MIARKIFNLADSQEVFQISNMNANSDTVDGWSLYIDAISVFIDFSKINGASDTILRNLFSTEFYIRRAVSKCRSGHKI